MVSKSVNLRRARKRASSNSESHDDKFGFIGYEIGGWGALLALITSVATLSLTAIDRWFLSARPVLRAPEIVSMFCHGFYDENPDDPKAPSLCPTDPDRRYLYVDATPITFINDTSAPHAFTVSSSTLLVSLISKDGVVTWSTLLPWFYFEGEIGISPITVAPQQNVSREVQYFPREYYVGGELLPYSPIDFRAFEDLLLDPRSEKLLLKFEAALLDSHEVLESSCQILIDDYLRQAAATRSKVYHTATCVPVPG